MKESEGEQQYFKFQNIDRRNPISNVNEYPYNNLVFLFSHKNKIGTAFLIDQYHVLTAAHNLFLDKCIFKDIYLYPYANNGVISIKDSIQLNSVFKLKDCRYPQEFLAHYDNKQVRLQHDIAVIRLNRPIIQEKYSKILFDHHFDLTKSPQVEVAGFPGEKIDSLPYGNIKINPYTHTDKLLQQTKTHLFYDADTTPGQSGSPVYYKHEGVSYVAGIHIYGSVSKRNQGISLTKRLIRQIIAWIKEMNPPTLLTYTLNEGGIEQTSPETYEKIRMATDSWHEMKSNKVVKSLINNNSSDINWELLINTKNKIKIENQTLTNLSEDSVFAISYMKIQSTKIEVYKAKIKRINYRILVGIITQERKKILLSESEKDNVLKYVLAFTSEIDAINGYGRIYFNESYYLKQFKKSDARLHARQEDQIKFTLNFIQRRLSLHVKNEEKLSEPLPQRYMNQNLYLYVMLGELNDSVEIVKLSN